MVRASSRRAVLLAPVMAGAIALALLLPACAPAAPTLRWTIDFASPALRTRTDSVVARVLAGGCSGDVIYETRLRSMGSMAVPPPPLAAGTYGLAAFALDDACEFVGSACRAVDVPMEGEVMLLLSSGGAACPADVCIGHGCDGPGDTGPRDSGWADGGDAGSRDAAMEAMDVGPVDGGPTDGGVDTGPRDTGPPDTGPRDAGTVDVGVDAAMCTSTAPRATGSFVASPWFSRVVASGASIQFSTSAGTMGAITLAGGLTATGTVTASDLCTMSCTPLSFRAVTASGHTLTFRDWMDVESTITIAGATATGGLELSGSDGYLVSVTAGMRSITFSNGATPAVTGTITLVPDTTCL